MWHLQCIAFWQYRYLVTSFTSYSIQYVAPQGPFLAPCIVLLVLYLHSRTVLILQVYSMMLYVMNMCHIFSFLMLLTGQGISTVQK